MTTDYCRHFESYEAAVGHAVANRAKLRESCIEIKIVEGPDDGWSVVGLDTAREIEEAV